MNGLTRRGALGGALAGLAAGLAGQVLAEAPLTSLRPPARKVKVAASARSAPSAEALIAEAKLGGQVSFALADAKTGKLLQTRQPDLAMPPASTAKAITSLYALTHLGAGYRFATRILATGPIKAGRLEGDLILAGGGDPTLTTDDLGDLAKALSQAGVRAISGRFYVWAGALPYLDAIDRGQPDWLGYNPSVAGLNLNFNRVNFVWQRGQGGYQVGFDARAERFAPPVYSARMQVVARDLPVFTYKQNGTIEDWTVAQAALGKAGSRWLPVRRPDLYAGDVFQTLARANGLALPAPEVLGALPEASRIVEHQSAALPDVLRDMMKYSTNMTAEVVGMTASMARGVAGHDASAAAMTRWLSDKTGQTGAQFVDHSGLGGGSRVTAADMVSALVRLGPQLGLGALMKDVRFKNAKGLRPGAVPKGVVAKSGTLNFVSALVGYMVTEGGEARVFAIYSGDTDRRDAVPDMQRENPPGLSGWLKRARRLQLQLLQSWA
jgi:D-alanyl-D-alanine carboxypeptidase/D-alanyl-D-alanine-endopeptidase (penicillin-binding protein 4)